MVVSLSYHCLLLAMRFGSLSFHRNLCCKVDFKKILSSLYISKFPFNISLCKQRGQKYCSVLKIQLIYSQKLQDMSTFVQSIPFCFIFLSVFHFIVQRSRVFFIGAHYGSKCNRSLLNSVESFWIFTWLISFTM